MPLSSVAGSAPGAGLLALALVLGSCAEEVRGPSAVLITLDTTRADALGCYGNARSSTPNLDRLAAEGVRFERAYAVAPLTLPSHTSMLTGLYPPRHGVRSNGPLPAPSSAATLAELASRAGLETAAFVSAAVLDARFGLAQGFARYDAPVKAKGAQAQYEERPGAETVARAADWLESCDGTPFFLWVHLFEPHAPYAPPAEFQGPAFGEPYLGEVAAADRAVGRLLEALESAGAGETTTVVVVGDHGEALGDHGEVSHGSLCYDATLHVPLIVRPAGGLGAGATEARVVSVADVFATLAAALDLSGVDAGDGQDLLASAAGPDRGVYFECYSGYVSYGWSPLAGWIDARGKYLHSSVPELYDLTADPREERNLFTDAAAVEPYRAAIARVAEAPALALDAAPLDDPELMAGIRALGYAAEARDVRTLPHPLAPSDRPAPAARAHEEGELHEAGELVRRGACDRARVILDRLSAENPHNLFALDMLAHCLQKSGETAQAIAMLQRLLAEDPPWPDSYQRLGTLLLAEGRADEALEAFAGGLSAEPDHAACLLGLARALEELGRNEEAAHARERASRAKR